MTTIENYDFSQHEAEHYATHEFSYGLAIIDEARHKILVIKTREGFYGFPKGHRNDNETAEDAAIRETREETGITISREALTGKHYSIIYEGEITEEQLNRHIPKQIARGERPHWNKPGPVTREAVIYVAHGDSETLVPKADIEEDVSMAEWLDIDEALRLMEETKSNHAEIMIKIMESGLRGENKKTAGRSIRERLETDVKCKGVIIINATADKALMFQDPKQQDELHSLEDVEKAGIKIDPAIRQGKARVSILKNNIYYKIGFRIYTATAEMETTPPEGMAWYTLAEANEKFSHSACLGILTKVLSRELHSKTMGGCDFGKKSNIWIFVIIMTLILLLILYLVWPLYFG